MMPRLSGFELCRKLERRKDLGRRLLVAERVTGKSGEDAFTMVYDLKS
ncbi:hypothetical protein [Paenibacillus sp. A3]